MLEFRDNHFEGSFKNYVDKKVVPQSVNLNLREGIEVSTRAQPDWAYEFPDRTEPDTQICRTGLNLDLYF